MRTMIMSVLVLLATASCAADRTPLSGACVDRVAPNAFDENAEDVPFKECQWQGRKWLCRLEARTNAWRCVAL